MDQYEAGACKISEHYGHRSYQYPKMFATKKAIQYRHTLVQGKWASAVLGHAQCPEYFMLTLWGDLTIHLGSVYYFQLDPNVSFIAWSSTGTRLSVPFSSDRFKDKSGRPIKNIDGRDICKNSNLTATETLVLLAMSVLNVRAKITDVGNVLYYSHLLLLLLLLLVAIWAILISSDYGLMRTHVVP